MVMGGPAERMAKELRGAGLHPLVLWEKQHTSLRGHFAQYGKSRGHNSGHSYRRATIGWTLIARRAGTEHATAATARSTTEAVTNVAGSQAPTPYASG
jgi:acyl transferase domain-containing protein